ncbi:stage V sporulation protein AB [Tepidibacter formicigenes]|uniref:Stage V sporulation protein AB n=1 Tax=Tepidibacter formicigenes DSM 15518 TaxID=1123349 RepID=A0A1M6NPE5_9FIRM|nr:stage V sporulation protein AB [Tepidibacter formicigenes]SHJ97573.1 stage V sporulation protein AB [Tepidibacter formicigenes DSM 15518]
MKLAFIVVLGFSEGVVVGAGVVALLTLLDIIPRLCQITNSYKYLRYYEIMLIMGAFFGSLFSLTNISFNFGIYTLIIVGTFYGIFIGLLASALAEAIDVIPVMERRLNIQGNVKYIIIVLIFGKLVGSIINWTILK